MSEEQQQIEQLESMLDERDTTIDALRTDILELEKEIQSIRFEQMNGLNKTGISDDRREFIDFKSKIINAIKSFDGLEERQHHHKTWHFLMQLQHAIDNDGETRRWGRHDFPQVNIKIGMNGVITTDRI